LLGCLAIAAVAAPQALALEIAGYEAKSDDAIQIKMKLADGKQAKECLIVLDKSSDEVASFDLSVCDLNFDGSLADEKALKAESANSRDYYYHKMKFEGPVAEAKNKGSYALMIYTHPPREYKGQTMFMGASCGLTMKEGEAEWIYQIRGIEMKADKNKPGVYTAALGAPLKLDVTSSTKSNGDMEIGASVKDKSGNSLRVSKRASSKDKVEYSPPHLKVTGPTGDSLFDKDLKYG